MISLANVDKQYGAKVLYHDVSASLNPAHRTGLIGPNGAGKTVLLRILAGRERVDGGTVTVPSNLRLGFLPQEMVFERAVTPLELVLEPFRHLLDSDRLFARLAEEKPGSEEYHRAARQVERLHGEMMVHDGYRLEARAEAILAGLGVPPASWSDDVRRLSGGYRMRTVLARLLLVSPDYLLLDEPTNHLDMDSLIWLEKFLLRFGGGMLVVSHDRAFLNRTTTHTAELDGGELTVFNGPVDAFLAWRHQHEETERNRARNVEKKIADAEAFVRRFKAKNTKASQARSKMKQLERLRDQLPDTASAERVLHFELPAAARSGGVPIRLENASLGYGAEPVLRDITLTITRGDKIAVIGPNGAGKSTLLKACAGLLEASAGAVSFGHNALIRYYSQHRLDQLHPDKTLIDTIADDTGVDGATRVQSILGAFMFSGDECRKRVGVLSGGEKSRLSLARILADPGNVLLLDEPTNHLDIETVERLADVLREYEGTVVLVSHDEFFVSRIATRIIEVRPGKLRDFPGTLDDYRAYLEEGYLPPLEGERQEPSTAPASSDRRRKEKRIRDRHERKRLSRRVEKLERELHELETHIEDTRAVLADPANARDYEALHKANELLARHQERYDTLLTEWDGLQEQLTDEG